jgi:hypothetical protein
MNLIIKIPLILLVLFILFSLFQGMFYLAKDDGKRDQTHVVRALTVRIALSLVVFLLLMGGYYFGLVEPHGK